jgi:GNAT superfamily N-acetyltransferase
MTADPALPDDADGACALIAETDPPVFRHLGGGDIGLALRLLDTLWRRPGTILSHDIARVVREGHRTIGVLIAMAGKARGRMLAETNAAAATLVPPERAAAIYAAWIAVDWLTPSIPDDAYYVQNLAVVSAARRRHLGAFLLEAACEAARVAGLAAVHLDVAADNSALAFYERCGFVRTVYTHVPSLDAHGIARHWRMVRPLAPAPVQSEIHNEAVRQ